MSSILQDLLLELTRSPGESPGLFDDGIDYDDVLEYAVSLGEEGKDLRDALFAMRG